MTNIKLGNKHGRDLGRPWAVKDSGVSAVNSGSGGLRACAQGRDSSLIKSIYSTVVESVETRLVIISSS